MVESCVKITKQLIYKSIRKNILNIRDFELLILKTVQLVNKRPIAFKNLDNLGEDGKLETITPEYLIRGVQLPMLNFVQRNNYDDDDPEWVPDYSPTSIVKTNIKLQKVRTRLVRLYNEYFLQNLISQAVDKKDRYKKVKHNSVDIGDIVFIKDPLVKRVNYPMGIIKSVTVNSLNEVTGVEVMKGDTREVVKRHITTIIPLLSVREVK